MTWGDDLDRSYSDRLRTGAGLVITILDERGYDFRSPWSDEIRPFRNARGTCHDAVTAGGCSFEVREP